MARRSNALQDLVEACEELTRAYLGFGGDLDSVIEYKVDAVSTATMKLTRKTEEDYSER